MKPQIDMSIKYLPEFWSSLNIYRSICLLRNYAPDSLSASTLRTGSGQRILLPICLELAMKGRLRQLKEAGHVPSHNSHWRQLKGKPLRLLQDNGYVPSHKLYSDLYALMQDVYPSAAYGLNASYSKLYKGKSSLADFLKDVDKEFMDSRYGKIDWELSERRGEINWEQYDRQIRKYDRRFFRRYDAAIIAVYQQANFLQLEQIPKGMTLRKVVSTLTNVSKIFATWDKN